jgi:hypothetical protein
LEILAHMRLLRAKFWLEACAALAGALFFLLLQLSGTWVETVFGVDPDGGDGAVETAFAVLSLALTIALVLAARANLRALRRRGARDGM